MSGELSSAPRDMWFKELVVGRENGNGVSVLEVSRLNRPKLERAKDQTLASFWNLKSTSVYTPSMDIDLSQ
ncbi:hypothetical protein HPP92_004992 [Vanilla planifolia]|uniref:Uncharacterized protein n=1 Tax=Vanilla planifolia TaxID=51239 RepID=A0A835RXW0_VANPL|nr:hypothetical protein HPP92_004992 [Vanilla planifolia]